MGFLKFILGGGGKVIKETAEVFTVNKEAQSQRGADLDMAVLAQYASEFRDLQQRNWFDALVDGVNRLIRPMLTICVILPLILTPLYPEKMAIVFSAWALLPELYWGILLAVIGFFFGGRMQKYAIKAKGGFASAAKAARDFANKYAPVDAPPITIKTDEPDEIDSSYPNVAEGPDIDPVDLGETDNAAINDWLAGQEGRAAA